MTIPYGDDSPAQKRCGIDRPADHFIPVLEGNISLTGRILQADVYGDTVYDRLVPRTDLTDIILSEPFQKRARKQRFIFFYDGTDICAVLPDT